MNKNQVKARQRQTLLSYDEAKKMVAYDPESGSLTWLLIEGEKSKIWQIRRIRAVGRIADKTTPEGYRRIRLKNQNWLSHRIVWLLFYGEWPNDEVDHIDGDGLNNKISNLRIATSQQNKWNSRVHKSNKLGMRNIFIPSRPQRKKYCVQFMHYEGGKGGRGKYLYKKSFETLEKAVEARDAVAARLHGPYTKLIAGS